MGQLKAAAGALDLEPEAGQWMAGFAARGEPARGTHDPLRARALWLEDGRTPLVLISCELIGFSPHDVARMRRRIAEAAPIPAENILIACTHTHSGPASAPLRGLMGQVDEGWLAQTFERIVALAVSLPLRLVPATIACASVPVTGIGYNRDDPARPTDEALTAVAIEGADGAAIATVVNYAVHSVVLGPNNLLFSGDYPGALSRHLERRRGGAGLFVPGACGDVDPVLNRDRGWGTGTFDDTEAIGERLADAAVAALAPAPRQGDATVQVAAHAMTLPLDPPPTREALDRLQAGFIERRASAAGLVERGVAEAMLCWAEEMAAALDAGRVPSTLEAELVAAAVGDLVVVALPFEPYSDIALAVKAALPGKTVLFAGYTNGLWAYLPVAWAKERGGYGPSEAIRWFGGRLTAMGRGAGETVTGEAIALASALVPSR